MKTIQTQSFINQVAASFNLKEAKKKDKKKWLPYKEYIKNKEKGKSKKDDEEETVDPIKR